jgi:hypothetical protein
MARPRNSALIAAFLLLFGSAGQAAADGSDNYIYNYLGRSDTITIGAGDSTRANLAIQHPTPWPPYVNDTTIHTPARIGTSALERMFQRYAAEGSVSAPSTAPVADAPN